MQFSKLLPKILETPKEKDIIVCQGGGDSTKTVSILQAIGVNHTQEPRILTTVTATDLPNLRGGAMRSFENYVLSDTTVSKYVHKILDGTRIFWKNKSILEFKSFENELDARGSERDYLYCNEVNGIPFNMFWQLQRKTRKRTYADYNPTSWFWMHDKVLPGPTQDAQYKDRVQLYITDHRHNPFLTAREHAAYESITDPDLFSVYSRGKTGKVKGVIFGHFKKAEAMPERQQGDRVAYGVDWGYTNDPTAIVKMLARGRQRWFQELCYFPGISEELVYEIIMRDWLEGDGIYCDHDLDMINKLRMMGLPAESAVKNIAAGIGTVRSHECYYVSNSSNRVKPEMSNFEFELATYKFMEGEDIVTGSVVQINKPVDIWNHLCDAARYADHTDSFRHAEE
jgi:phage terminase large subunit